MKILVIHAWLKGNLGDVLQLSVLLGALRELKPARIDLAGYPATPGSETGEVLALADQYLPDTFPWYWTLSPRPIGTAVFEPWWTRRRRRLFAQYDAIVCAPGPYLASYDLRVTGALADIAIAADLGLPVVLSSHSIGPLDARDMKAIARAAALVARESATYRFLHEHGLPSVRSADYAFLYPYSAKDARPPVDGPYRLVFLRSNNLRSNRLRIEGGALFEGDRLIAESGARFVLATSDRRRDGRFLRRVARTLDLPVVVCGSVEDMVQAIAGSSGVVSDRYHPAICAAALGKPAQVIPNREPHKMEGLRDLLAERPLDELQELARTGLRTVQETLRIRV